MPRPLSQAEIDELLHGDHVARFTTIDSAGYPHVTPLWFLWEQDVIYLASDTGRPHLARMRANPLVRLLIDTEDPERPEGERPNRQLRVVGNAELHHDVDGERSRRIWAKYVSGQSNPAALANVFTAATEPSSLIRPHRTIAAASP